MKIGYGPDQQVIITAYEPGDMVALLSDQTGEYAIGKAGDWGKVKAVDSAGRLTIQVAGYSMSTASAVVNLSGIPSRMVRPCDTRGRPVTPMPDRARLSDALWRSKWDRRQ
jgi:hypothetical protein